jgi:hypothetical protein
MSSATNWLKQRIERVIDEPEQFLVLESWGERFAFLMLPLSTVLLALAFSAAGVLRVRPRDLLAAQPVIPRAADLPEHGGAVRAGRGAAAGRAGASVRAHARRLSHGADGNPAADGVAVRRHGRGVRR